MDRERNLDNTPSPEAIERYLSGKMTPEEANTFEAALEKDPFLKEAMEGLALVHPEELSEAMDDINYKVKNLAVPAPSPLNAWYLAAASVIVAITAGCLYFLSGNIETKQQEAIAVSAPAPAESSDTEFPYKWEIKNADKPNVTAIGNSATEKVSAESEKPTAASALSLNVEKEKTSKITPPDIQSDSLFTVNIADSEVREEIITSYTSAGLSENVAKPVKKAEAANYSSMKSNSSEFRKISKAKSANEISEKELQNMLEVAISESEKETSSAVTEIKKESKIVSEKKRDKSLKECENCPEKITSDTDALFSKYPYQKFKEGDYQNASAYFDEYLKSNPNDNQAVLYNAISKLFNEEINQSEKQLNILKERNAYPETTEWLELYILLIKKENKKADTALEKIKNKQSIYSESAEKLDGKINY